MRHRLQAHRFGDDAQPAGLIEAVGRRTLAANDDAQSLAQTIYALDGSEWIVDPRRERAERHFDQLADGEGKVLLRRPVLAEHNALAKVPGDLVGRVRI